MRPPITRCPAYLRITGDDLVPEKLSELLGCSPTSAEVKGDRITIPDTKITYTADTGRWVLITTDVNNIPSLDVQIGNILARLTNNTDTWKEIGQDYNLTIFCGLFMDEDQQSLCISSKTISELGKRGIGFEFDIYDPD